MFPSKRGILHESVANILEGMGVKKKGETNPPNNASFVTEGLKLSPGKGLAKAAAPVTESTAAKPAAVIEDETDGDEGDKAASTKADNKPTSTKVKNDKADTECKNDKKADESEEAKALAFYEAIKRPLMITVKEDGSAEVLGLTEEELAPFGGKAPVVPKKYTQKDGKNDDNKKPFVGTLMLYSAEGMDKKSAVLMGKAIACAGWSSKK